MTMTTNYLAFSGSVAIAIGVALVAVGYTFGYVRGWIEGYRKGGGNEQDVRWLKWITYRR